MFFLAIFKLQKIFYNIAAFSSIYFNNSMEKIIFAKCLKNYFT